MDILVVSVGRLNFDPRSQNVINSISAKGYSIGTLEIQTAKPNVREILRKRLYSTITLNSDFEVKRLSTWTSRQISRQRWDSAIRDEGSVFGHVLQSLALTQNQVADSYWLSQFSLAYSGLCAFIEEAKGEYPRIILAEDLASAAGALILRPLAGWSIIYDAHELFTESLLLADEVHSESAIEVFRLLEQTVWSEVESLITVSPGLAQFINQAIPKRAISVLPNLYPVAAKISTNQTSGGSRVRCVYSGGVAPFRQVRALVENWPTGSGAEELHLYLAPSRLAKEVMTLAAKNTNVHLHECVEPDELIDIHSRYDLGIVPYKYPYPYNHASPNKFGEYIAAGLAVLCEEGSWVADLVTSRQIGATGSFNSKASLSKLLDQITQDSLKTWRLNVSESFRLDLNWDAHAPALHHEIEVLWDALHEKARDLPSSRLTVVMISQLPTIYLEILLEWLRPFLLSIYRGLRHSRFARFLPSTFIKRVA